MCSFSRLSRCKILVVQSEVHNEVIADWDKFLLSIPYCYFCPCKFILSYYIAKFLTLKLTIIAGIFWTDDLNSSSSSSAFKVDMCDFLGSGLCSVVDQQASSSMVTATTTTLYDQTWQGWCRHHFSSAIWAVSVTVSFWCLAQLAIGHHLCLCVTYTGPSSASSGWKVKWWWILWRPDGWQCHCIYDLHNCSASFQKGLFIQMCYQFPFFFCWLF